MQYWRRKTEALAAVLATAMSVAVASPAAAVDVDPGEYEAAPPGTSFLIGYGLFNWYEQFRTRSGRSVSDSRLNEQVGILRPVHFVDIFGITADPQFFLIYGFANNGKLGGAELDDAHGFGDIILASTFWIINDQEKKRWFGITPFVWLPVGEYNRKQVLNIGENRWKGAFQLGYVEHFAEKWAADFYFDTTIYGDNDSFGPGRDKLKQDPSYQFQTFLRYYITPEWSVGPGYSATWGGYTRISGEPDPQLQTQNQQLRLTTQYFFTPDLQFQAQARTDVWTEGGYQNTFGLRFRILKVF